MHIYCSESNNPQENLAMELCLLNRSPVQDQAGMLFLYVNNPAVVIGRFQNPWKECRTGLAHRLAIPVIRRHTGGGTVVHDTGNLNWSFISGIRKGALDAVKIQKHRNLDRIIRALQSMGLALTKNDRFDLILETDSQHFKTGGSAFRITANRLVHHGTLLVRSDLPLLRRLLEQAPRCISGQFTRSVPSPVTNLSGTIPELSVSRVMGKLCRDSSENNRVERIDPQFFSEDLYRNHYTRLCSAEWNWNKTGDFTETFPHIVLDNTALQLGVTSGTITRAPEHARFLCGTAYQGDSILQKAQEHRFREGWIQVLSQSVDGDYGQG